MTEQRVVELDGNRSLGLTLGELDTKKNGSAATHRPWINNRAAAQVVYLGMNSFGVVPESNERV